MAGLASQCTRVLLTRLCQPQFKLDNPKLPKPHYSPTTPPQPLPVPRQTPAHPMTGEKQAWWWTACVCGGCGVVVCVPSPSRPTVPSQPCLPQPQWHLAYYTA